MSRPVRVLHVSQPVDAGVAAVVSLLCRDQIARGWDVRLACPPGPLSDDAARAGVTVERWTSDRSPRRGIARERRALARIVADFDPDVVHLHSSKAGLVGRLAVRGRRPTIFQPHAWSFAAVTGVTERLARRWERVGSQWTDQLLCVSHDELAVGRASGIDAPAAVVANGVDTARFHPRPSGPARQELGLGNGPIALCLGRLTQQKGQDLLLDAWADVRAEVPDATLVFVGDGPDGYELRSRGADGSVLWRATTDKPELYYAAADVVAMPSRWEGMPLVALEATAAGRPVVGFDVTGIREAIGNGGVTVPPNDLNSFAEELARRLRDPDLAAREGAAGRRRTAKNFDHRLTVDAMADIVRSLSRNSSVTFDDGSTIATPVATSALSKGRAGWLGRTG